jgi:tRNA-dihydrouridine synthase 2
VIEWCRVPSHGQKEPPADAKESIIYKLHPEQEGRKLIFQVGTSDPDRAVACAKLVAADVAGIDVNAGCPKPFSTSGGMGAALLQTPDKLCAILEALVREIVPEFEIGISVKIRLLETADKTEVLVRRLCATGIAGLTIHCRTTSMRKQEAAIRAQLRMIADVCREAGVACLMNGDVENRDQALELIKEFGVDGAMIASAAEKNPSCFRSQADGGLASWQEVAAEYMKIAMETENKFGNTKFLLAHMVPGRHIQYRPISQAKCYVDLCESLQLQNLLEAAEAADTKIELGKHGRPARKGKANQVAMAAGGGIAAARAKEKEKRRSMNSQRGPQHVESMPAAAEASAALA